MRLGRFAAVLLILSLVSVTTPARAQDLASALELESQGQLAAALSAFEEILSLPGNTRGDLATIYQHLGLLRFADGDEEGVREAMMWLLTVEPDASLPDSAPPEVQDILSDSRERWSGRALHAEVGEVRDAGRDEVTIHVRAVDDVARMVEAIELVDGDAVLAADGERSPWELTVPRSIFADGERTLVVRLLDEHGGVLWDDEVDVSSTASEPRRGIGLEPRIQRILGWSLIGAGGLFIIGGGVAAGVDGTPTGEVRVVDGMLEQEVRATATGGWILISSGLAAAVAGMVLLLLMPRQEENDEAAARLLMALRENQDPIRLLH